MEDWGPVRWFVVVFLLEAHKAGGVVVVIQREETCGVRRKRNWPGNVGRLLAVEALFSSVEELDRGSWSYEPASSCLSSFPLQPSNSLLSPFCSHLEEFLWIEIISRRSIRGYRVVTYMIR